MTTAIESAVSRPLERMLRGARALGFATRASVFRMSTHPIWTENALADLRREFGDVYGGRTVLVTGADGFMGSHLTDALVELGAERARLRPRDLERRAEQHRRTCATG